VILCDPAMAKSGQGAAEVQGRFVAERLNPMLEDLALAVLLQKPNTDDLVYFIAQHLHDRYPEQCEEPLRPGQITTDDVVRMQDEVEALRNEVQEAVEARMEGGPPASRKEAAAPEPEPEKLQLKKAPKLGMSVPDLSAALEYTASSTAEAATWGEEHLADPTDIQLQEGGEVVDMDSFLAFCASTAEQLSSCGVDSKQLEGVMLPGAKLAPGRALHGEVEVSTGVGVVGVWLVRGQASVRVVFCLQMTDKDCDKEPAIAFFKHKVARRLLERTAEIQVTVSEEERQKVLDDFEKAQDAAEAERLRQKAELEERKAERRSEMEDEEASPEGQTETSAAAEE